MAYIMFLKPGSDGSRPHVEYFTLLAHGAYHRQQVSCLSWPMGTQCGHGGKAGYACINILKAVLTATDPTWNDSHC